MQLFTRSPRDALRKTALAPGAYTNNVVLPTAPLVENNAQVPVLRHERKHEGAKNKW